MGGALGWAMLGWCLDLGYGDRLHLGQVMFTPHAQGNPKAVRFHISYIRQCMYLLVGGHLGSPGRALTGPAALPALRDFSSPCTCQSCAARPSPFSLPVPQPVPSRPPGTHHKDTAPCEWAGAHCLEYQLIHSNLGVLFVSEASTQRGSFLPL